jgi:hypothetical protein
MYQPTEDVLPRPIPIGGLAGMDTQSPLPSMDPAKSRLVKNLNIRYGAYKTRDGTDTVGTISGSELLMATDVLLPNGKYYLVRWRVDGVDVLINNVWTPAGGDVWAGSKLAPFALTGWVDRLIFTAGMGKKLFELTFDPPMLAEIPDSPTEVIHLATFNGRVMASGGATGEVSWTVKNDHTDWTGLGSGFEDLRSAPGGRPDSQTAIVPISDELAYCIRSQSIWQVGNTGDFDAPFAFTRLFTYVGSRWPQTVVATSQGVICMGDTGQVWMIQGGGYVDIAEDIHDITTNMEQGFKRLAMGAFDLKRNEYRLTRPDINSLTAQVVLRYSISNKAWTEDVYPFPIRSISYTQFVKKLTVDELTGSVNALVGTVDDLGVGVRNPGAVYTMPDEGRWVVRDDSLKNSLALRDVNFAGARVASGFRIESGDVKVADPIKRQEFVELLCWYEAEEDVTLNFDYSYDGGKIWALASQVLAPATNGRPRAIKVQRTADRAHLQFAVSTEATPDVKLISFQAVMREGARTVDTSP